MEDIPISNMPTWIKRLKNYDPTNGGYSMEPLQSCPSTLQMAFKHSGRDVYAEETDPEWRRANLTIEGLAVHANKHARSHPLAWLLTGAAGDTMYAQARSDTWNSELGLQNVASTCLKASIEHLRSGQEDEIWNELAPIREIDDNSPNTFFWTTNFYESTMALQTTQRGMPNVVEAQMRTGVGRLNYYKIKGQVHFNFFKSEMGTAHWHHVLISMARALVLGGQYAAAVKLANADIEYADRVSQDGGYLPTIDAHFDHVSEFWAYFQKPHHNNVAALRTMFENRLRVQGAHPGKYNWLITKATYDCIAKFDEHSLRHEITSERGLDLLESHVAVKVIISGDSVYVMSPFMLPRRILDQPFAQPVEISEHFEMFAEPYDGRGTTIDNGDRFVFDMRTKTIKKISFDFALKNLICWGNDANGTLRAPLVAMETTLNHTDQAKQNLCYFPYTIGADGAIAPVMGFPASRVAAEQELVRLRAPVGQGQGRGAQLPFNILAIRVHEKYYTDNSYFLLPGKVVERVQKSGEAIISDIAPDFVHEITAEALLGAACTDPQNIVKAPNTTITGYIEGGGTRPLLPSDNYDPHAEFQSGDIVFIPVPTSWTLEDVPRNINLHGCMIDKMKMVYAEPEDKFANWYPGCAYANAVMGWRANETGLPSKRYYDRSYRKVPWPASFVSRRMTYYISDATGNPTKLRTGNGYWGLEGTYHTCGNARIGGTFSDHPERGTGVTFVSG